MSFWKVDLTTRDGAENAAQMGGLACFIAAGLAVLGLVLLVASSGYESAEAIGAIAGVLIEMLIFVVAGFRLRAGKGLVWGSIATVLLVIEIVAKLVTLSGIPGLIINVILLVGMVNGVRGARALKSGNLTADQVAEVFDNPAG